MRRSGPPVHAERPGPRSLLACAGIVLSVALAGCMTGQRPTLGTAPTVVGLETGDANVDVVLTLLDGVSNAVFTAQYDATLRFGGTVTAVTVTQDGPSHRSVTIGDTRYITDATGTRTCIVSAGTCVAGADQQPISNTGVTSDLVFGDVAKRLRRFADTRTAATTAAQNTIAGQTATCVDLPLGTNVSTFCALADGVLARLIDGDVTVELTSYAPTPDITLFTPA